MFALAEDPQIGVSVAQAALACCALEFDSALVQGLLVEVPDQPGNPVVLVVSGTITEANAPQLMEAYAALPEPKRVVAFGACASSGGPYEGGYAIVNGADVLFPVDAYVPGCPPTPKALIAAIQQVAP